MEGAGWKDTAVPARGHCSRWRDTLSCHPAIARRWFATGERHRPAAHKHSWGAGFRVAQSERAQRELHLLRDAGRVRAASALDRDEPRWTYFLRAQFRTIVIGDAEASSVGAWIRKRWPSCETSYSDLG